MLVYLIQVSLCWGIFALLYAAFLRRETFFRFNRAYLLLTVLLGMALPLAGAWAPALPADAEEAMLALPAIIVGLQTVEQAARDWSWMVLLVCLYWGGFSLALLRLSWGIGRLVLLARRGDAERLPDGCILVRTGQAELPFSFFRWIFVPREFEPRGDFANMLAHERAHVHGGHSIDVLLAEILCVMFWFHPLAHWYRQSLRTVHEYLADREASAATDRRQYGLLLVRQAQPRMATAFANHFFQSPLKQRLLMLTKKTSAPVQSVKYGLLAPVVFLLFLLNRQMPAPVQEGTPKPDATGQLVYEACDRLPEFPGGWAAFGRYMQENLVYPPDDKQTKRTGRIAVKFVVNTDGSVEQVETETIDGAPSAAMFAEAARAIRQSPAWIPAEQGGEQVKCRLRLPVLFKLE